MNLDLDPARVRPVDVALGLAVGQKAVIVENEFDQLDSESMNLVKILFRQSRHQKQSSGVNLHTRWAQVVVATFRNNRHGQRSACVRRQRKTGQMQLSGRN